MTRDRIEAGRLAAMSVMETLEEGNEGASRRRTLLRRRGDAEGIRPREDDTARRCEGGTLRQQVTSTRLSANDASILKDQSGCTG